MSTDNTAIMPATPQRTTPMQVLSGLFRTPTRLRTPKAVSRHNKRARTSSLSSSTPPTTDASSLPAVVLQSYSVSTDSIVLTALPSVPFCCHEDLLTMSRAQLESVVRALNARLPRRMRIGPEDDFWNNDQDRGYDNDHDRLSRMSDTEIRRRVEELVGIRAIVGKNRVSRSGLGLGTRAGVPPAPKAVRTRDVAWRPYERTPWEMELDGAEDRPDGLCITIDDALMGSSPLAGRAKSGPYMRGRSDMLPRLASLQEENEVSELKEEDSGENERRPTKRQRVSFASVTKDSENGSQVVQEVRESKLVENMDLSGSPLLAMDDAFLDLPECDETVASPNNAAKMPEEVAQTPLQRRRSARIKEITLKRTCAVGAGKKNTSDTRGPRTSFLSTRKFSSRRLAGDTPTPSGVSDTRRDSGTPRECTIRLPFASTPPLQKPESLAWSATRILRSHSQRLLSSSRSAKTKSSLERSQSERYPRASDLAFVTINRPRYRFTQRKSKGVKVVKEDQASYVSESTSLEHRACKDTQISTEHLYGKREHEKEKDDPIIATRDSAIGNLETLPSALCSFLAPRSRAPSTSTVASARGNCGDSPARMTREVAAPTAAADFVASDGATEHVSESLERMAVDSL